MSERGENRFRFVTDGPQLILGHFTRIASDDFGPILGSDPLFPEFLIWHEFYVRALLVTSVS